MSILILGGMGGIGRALIEALLRSPESPAIFASYNSKEPDLVKLKSGLTDFLNFGKDPKKKDQKNKPVKLGKLQVALVSNLPELEDDEAQSAPEDSTEAGASPRQDESLQDGSSPKAEVDPAGLFTKRLKAILPDLKRAQSSDHPDSGDLKLFASEAQTLARRKDFEAALIKLDELERAVASIGDNAGETDQEDLATRFALELDALQSDYEQAIQGPESKAIKTLQVI